MGLDMYLHARKRKAVNAEPEEAIYWRKANAIHGWFDENVADEYGINNCKSYAVSREKLVELRDLIHRVTESKETDLLPPVAGFFFGSTVVDEWYWIDLEFTARNIDRVLEEYPEEDWDFEYIASW
jgi:hypothetical protein